MKIKNFSLPFLGFLQATGLLVYLILIALFFSNANKIFGSVDNKFLAPIAFLLLFIISALISGTLVLAKAGILFWEKRYKEAFTLLGWTTAWSVLYLLAVFVMLFTAK